MFNGWLAESIQLALRITPLTELLKSCPYNVPGSSDPSNLFSFISPDSTGTPFLFCLNAFCPRPLTKVNKEYVWRATPHLTMSRSSNNSRQNVPGRVI